jgi:putative endonuclease
MPYWVYITTNSLKNAVYIGVTNNLHRRMKEHYENRGQRQTFAGRYYCYYLIYFEGFQSITEAIRREKEIKGWGRPKKDALIDSVNPEWDFLSPP